MALAESDAPETVRFGAGGDSMRSHPSRGSSPNGGIEEGREKWRGEAAQSGSRLAGFVAVPARFPGRGCASLARSREGVIAGDLGEKVMELEGCKISCWPDYPCRVVAGGRPRTQSVCLGWVWGCPLESSVSRASLPLQSLLPPSWRLHFGGCIFTKGQLLQSA